MVKIRSKTKNLKEMLPAILRSIEHRHAQNPTAVLAYWTQLIGPELSKMTQAISLNKGVLTVKVKNSTLYSLLCQSEKPKLLKKIQKKFSQETVKDLLFRC
jgi:predicted nucleic acid-binding Zn ribbon protein